MRVGPYEVVDRIGQGGAGVVFRARGPDGRLLALKVLKDRSPDGRARFAREARLLATFGEAEGFVPLLDHGDCPEGPYLVMPFVDGGSLRDRLARGPLALGEALALARSLGGALANAHLKGVVHRDVKPENILRHGDRWLLADLGLAKHFDARAAGASLSVSLSREGSFRGTIGYMAPEQLNDSKSVGPPADVFALGAVLHECLAGTPAFHGDNVPRVVQAVLEGRVDPLRTARPEVPRWLEAVVLRALAASADDRYATAAELLVALDTRKEARPGRRRRLALLLAAFLVAGVVAAVLLRPSTPPAKVPEVAPPRVVRPLAVEVHALLEAREAPGDDVVAAIASGWGDERIRTDALALAELFPRPFVSVLEARGEPRPLLLRAWLASGALAHYDEVRAALPARDPVGAAMAIVEDLGKEVVSPTRLLSTEDIERIVAAVDRVKPATLEARSLVLLPVTRAILGSFDRADDHPGWISALVKRLRKGGCPAELQAYVALGAEGDRTDVEALVKALPVETSIGLAIRYDLVRRRSYLGTATKGDLEALRTETAALHARGHETDGSLKAWIDAHEALARTASTLFHDWPLAIAIAHEDYDEALPARLKARAAGTLVIMQLASDPELKEVDGLDDADRNQQSPLFAEVLWRRGDLAHARTLCQRILLGNDADPLALEVLVRVEGASGNLAEARRRLERLEKLEEPAGMFVPIHTKASTRAWLEELEARQR